MSDQHSHTGQTWRLEHDSLGDVRVPADRYWGAQTERARHRFQIGNDPIPLELIHAIACLKRMAAQTNHQLGVLDEQRCQWISEAAREVEAGTLDGEFPLSCWQSGTEPCLSLSPSRASLESSSRLSG